MIFICAFLAHLSRFYSQIFKSYTYSQKQHLNRRLVVSNCKDLLVVKHTHRRIYYNENKTSTIIQLTAFLNSNLLRNCMFLRHLFSNELQSDFLRFRTRTVKRNPIIEVMLSFRLSASPSV